jgi:hypothetical protein
MAVRRYAVGLIHRQDEGAARARQFHGAQYALDLPVAVVRRELDAKQNDL